MSNKNTGLTIVVNGCFDLLHRAHVILLHRALHYSQNGRVAILLNNDESVERLKGHGRPINSIQDREANILDVCREWLFDNDSKTTISVTQFNHEEELAYFIDLIAPDIILRGNDITDITRITGSYNWPVCIAPRPKDEHGNDISTTNILKGINEENVRIKTDY